MNPRPRRNAMIPFPEIENRSLRRHRSKRAAKQNFHFIFTFSSRSRKFLASRREVHERGRVPETDRKTRNKNSEISESFEHWRTRLRTRLARENTKTGWGKWSWIEGEISRADDSSRGEETLESRNSRQNRVAKRGASLTGRFAISNLSRTSKFSIKMKVIKTHGSRFFDGWVVSDQRYTRSPNEMRL